ncbi:hypothetical protein DWW90_00470 [Parabacteroides sp. AF17-28]|nr:hypothetical protein DWW90_00470 [Parabacteroides sp. AF17-28]
MVSALNAHQLRPEVEPGGSVEDCDTACSFAIPHRVRERGASLSPSLTRGRKRAGGVGHPKRKRSFLRKA